MPPDHSHPDHQYTSQRGGLPLEARLPPRIREGSTPTLGNTIAASRGIAVLIVTGGSLYAVYTLVKKWLEQNGRSKARDEALRELLGVPDDEEEVEQLMPGSATVFGSFVTTGGLESKSKIGGKRGKRVVSKSNDAPQLRSRSSSASLRSPTTNQHSTTPPIQHLASKLKAFIPALSASSSKAIHVIPASKGSTSPEEATTSNATNAVKQVSSEQEAGRTEPDMQQPTLTAAERKKLKKKQNRANRAQDKSLLSGSAESDVRDSPSPGGSIISLPSTFEHSVFSKEDASRDVHMLDPVRSRRPERPNAMYYKNTSDPELVTPTATANTTPKASTRSKMAGPLPVSMLRDESPTRRRSSASTDDDNADMYRDSISSAPSLVSAFSPKSGRSRAESVVSLPPVTPLTTNAGLNLPDADLGTMKEDENERAWQKVGKKEKAERKQKGKGRLEAESRMGPVSPPVSTASGTSSEFNLLMNADSRPTQSSTDASSIGWSSEAGQAGPCPECAQRRRNGEASSERISELQKKLEETIGEQRKQNAIIDSLTGTNIGLSGQLATLRDQRDKSMAEARVARDQLDGLRRELDEARMANKQLDGLRRELGEARDMTVRLQTQMKQHQDYESFNIDYKRKFDNMVQKHETYRLHTTRVSDEAKRNTVHLETQVGELSRILEHMRFQAYPGAIPTNQNAQYTLLPAPMMMPPPNSQGMPPGMGNQPPYPHNAYMLSSPPSATFPGRDAGPRRVSPHQPSRPRYEGNPTSASGLAPTEIYNNQPAGMWALNSSSTARPPHSPSRNADISSAILKTRRASADGTAAVSGQDGVGDDHAGIGGSSSLPLAPCAAVEEESQTGILSSGEDVTQDQQATTEPSDSQSTQPASSGSTGMSPSALAGSIPPGLKREPGRRLEFTFPRKTPSENDGDAGNETETPAIDTTATTDPPQTESANQTLETTTEPEEDYDEPVYASIRP